MVYCFFFKRIPGVKLVKTSQDRKVVNRTKLVFPTVRTLNALKCMSLDVSTFHQCSHMYNLDLGNRELDQDIYTIKRNRKNRLTWMKEKCRR